MNYYVIDTETTDLSPHKGEIFYTGYTKYDSKFKKVEQEVFDLFGGLTADEIKEKGYPKNADSIKPLLKILANDDAKILHNAKFDLEFYMRHGAKEFNGPIYDTYVMAKMSKTKFESYNLENLAKHLFKIEDTERNELEEWKTNEIARRKALFKTFLKEGIVPKELWFKRVNKDSRKWDEAYEPNYSDIPRKIIAKYFKKDITNPMELYKYFFKDLQEDEDLFKLFIEIETKVPLVLAHMEYEGHLMDKKLLEESRDKFTKIIDKLEKKIQKATWDDFNPGSDKDIITYMTKKKLPITKYTDKGNVKVDKEALSAFNDKVLNDIVIYSTYSSLRNTFINGFLERMDSNNYLHTEYDQFKRTGRLSSGNPNLQNIPIPGRHIKNGDDAVIKKSFIPEKGYSLFYFDYKQIEMVITAIFTAQPEMVDAIKNKEDLHQTVANLCGIPREAAKAIQFGLIYGMGRPTTLAKFITLGVESKEIAKKAPPVLEKYYSLMDEAKALKKAGDIGGERAKKKEAFAVFDTIWLDSKTKQAMDAYFGRFNMVKNFSKETNDVVWHRNKHEGQGYIRTLMGRYSRLETYEAYKALNYIVQGSAADLMKAALVKVFEALKGTQSKIKLTIHDELAIAIKNSERKKVVKLVSDAMTSFDYELPFRIDIEYSETSWGDKDEYVA